MSESQQREPKGEPVVRITITIAITPEQVAKAMKMIAVALISLNFG